MITYTNHKSPAVLNGGRFGMEFSAIGTSVELRVEGVEISGIQLLLFQSQAFTKISNLSKGVEILAAQGFLGSSSKGKNGWTSPDFAYDKGRPIVELDPIRRLDLAS